MQLDVNHIKASLYRDSYFEFLRGLWHTVIPDEPVLGWHVKLMCDEMQDLAERVFRKEDKSHDLIINVPPGSTKSTVCSVFFPAWVYVRMPEARIICGSYAYALAMELSRKSRMVIESDTYRELFPEVQLRDDQNTKGYFATTAGGGRYSVGAGGAVTGHHADFIIIDDPLSPLEATSEADLNTANQWMRETLPTRKTDKAVTPTVLIQQRLHQNDQTGEWIDRTEGKGIRHICLPCDDSWPIKPEHLKAKYEEGGGLLDPVRLNRNTLDEYRLNGEYAYASQMGQSPVPRGGGLFKPEMLQYVEAPTDKIIASFRSWDCAATAPTSGKDPCYTAGVLLHQYRNGRFCIAGCRRGRWETHKRQEIIRQTAEMDGQNVKIVIEHEGGSAGKDSAQAHVKNLAGFRVEMVRPSGDKSVRAEPVSAQVNMGMVDILVGNWNNEFVDEMTYFPLSTFKDQIDALAGAFNAMNLTARRKPKVMTW